ncbi:MAG: DUF4124 domain-containing protein [Deltaproteobacteria bacterium]|nr:DUF4124 domain-containing protein [Deltaproteobacteria bacterium]MBW2612596.1 DUF4124 domain-containing protein [Deltaproteobacteria bacterium]
MKVHWWILILAALLMASVSQAEYYKYTDENGVLRFTDNLQEVPKSQRKDVKEYWEIKSDDAAQPGSPTEDAAEAEDMKTREETLRNEKAVLDQEYEALDTEKRVLEAESKKTRSKSENKKFEARIEAYNARTADYEEKRLVFKEKVDAFNADVKTQ